MSEILMWPWDSGGRTADAEVEHNSSPSGLIAKKPPPISERVGQACGRSLGAANPDLPGSDWGGAVEVGMACSESSRLGEAVGYGGSSGAMGGGGSGGTSSMGEGIGSSDLSLGIAEIGKKNRTADEKKLELGTSSSG